jgi:hypothetical protein
VGLPILGVLLGVGVAGGRIAAKLQPFMPANVDMASALRLSQPALWLPAVIWLVTGAALAAAAHRPDRWRQGALLAVLLVDLALFGQHQGWRVVGPIAPSGLGERPAVMPPETRLLSVSASGYPYHDPPLAMDLRYGMLEALWRERAAHGYEPFLKSRYSALMGGMSHGGAIAQPDVFSPAHHGLDLLAVRTLKLDPESQRDPVWAQRLDSARWRAAGAGVYTNTRALPRAWRVEHATMLTPELVDTLVTTDVTFDAAREALLEEGHVPPTTPGPATARALSADRIEVTTDGAGPGLVVVSESFDTGWQAFEGDRPVPVHRVDGLVMGLEVPAGPHAIALRYAPPRWGLGVALSVVAALLMGLWAFWLRRRGRA